MHGRLLLTIVFLLASLLTPAASTFAQSSSSQEELAREKAGAATALQDLFGLAASRDFNALYDHMHPDARAEVSRTAALNLFSDVYSAALASEAIITGVELSEWTWEVNGRTYPEAAVMDIIIPIVDDDGKLQWVEDTWYLAKDQGEWLWFLGSTREFVDQVNANYGAAETFAPADTTGAVHTVAREDFILVVANDLDEFFREVVGYTEFDYESPGVVVVSEGTGANSACGPAQTGFLGFYCPLDQTIYLDEPFLLGLYDRGDDFAAAFVISHEWVHHVQTGLGFERTTQPSGWNQLHSIELELMADCFSGAWTLDAEVRGLVEPGDLEEATNLIFYELGDPKFVEEFAPQSHGTGEQRIAAFMNGYELGFLGCNLKL